MTHIYFILFILNTRNVLSIDFTDLSNGLTYLHIKFTL